MASGHLFPTSRRCDVHGVILVHVITEGVVRGVGTCDARVRTVCVQHVGWVSFSTRAPAQALTTTNQRRTQTRILSPSSMWWTAAFVYLHSLALGLSYASLDNVMDAIF